MSAHYLKFASYVEAVTVIETNQSELLWNDNGTKRIKGKHDFSVVVVDCYHKTGVILQTPDGFEYPEQVLVAGFHVNINSNIGLPAYLSSFEVFPVTPSVTWS